MIFVRGTHNWKLHKHSDNVWKWRLIQYDNETYDTLYIAYYSNDPELLTHYDKIKHLYGKWLKTWKGSKTTYLDICVPKTDTIQIKKVIENIVEPRYVGSEK